MLFPSELFEPIRRGEVTVAIRSWKRPTVRAGGTLQSGGGLLQIDAVEVIEASDLGDDDVRDAGAPSLAELLAWLPQSADRRLYRIRFHRLGDDPRIALRQDDALDAEARAAIAAQLARWDGAAKGGPWTAAVLGAVVAHPAEPARVLAAELGAELLELKRRVRQLKGLGLTESLGTGYRISPRGARFLEG